MTEHDDIPMIDEKYSPKGMHTSPGEDGTYSFRKIRSFEAETDYMVYCGDEPVGSVQVYDTGEETVSFHIGITPDEQGKGHGGRIVSHLGDTYKQEGKSLQTRGVSEKSRGFWETLAEKGVVEPVEKEGVTVYRYTPPKHDKQVSSEPF